jgi:serine/threonine-protein kinase RsbT
MNAADGGGPLLEVLSDYFSPPLARALLASTLRRARLDGAALSPVATRQAVQALESALPLYLGDPARRAECLARLRARAPQPANAGPASAPGGAAPAAPAPVSARGPVPEATSRSLASARAPVDVDPQSAPIVIHVASADDVTNACEVGRDIARRVGFSGVAQTKIATAIAELARNILLYAKTGEVRLVTVAGPRRGVEVDASDRGPGIADVAHVMSGNYRSRTGMGMGLRGAKRLMDDFAIDTSPEGTRVVARKYLA